MEAAQKRFDYIDWAKAIAILCIVSGHFFPTSGIKSLLYSFHVPIFALIGGFLASAPSCGRAFGKKLGQLCLRLLVPYLIWYWVFAIPHLLPEGSISLSLITNKPRTLKQLFEGMFFLRNETVWNDAMWFLPVYFIASVVGTFITWQSGGNRFASLIMGSASLAGVVLMEHHGITVDLFGITNIFSMRNVFILLGFYMLGYAARPVVARLATLTKRRWANPVAYLSAIAFVLLATAVLDTLKVPITKWNPQGYYALSLFGGKYNDMLNFVLYGLGLSFSLVGFCIMLPSSRFARLFSRHSFFVMLTHYAFFFVDGFTSLGSSMWQLDYALAYRDAAFINLVYWFVLLAVDKLTSRLPISKKFLRLVGFN